jgi:hypothetical protein
MIDALAHPVLTLGRCEMSDAREDLKFAVEQIDHVFGTGYAKAHPELVAPLSFILRACMQQPSSLVTA